MSHTIAFLLGRFRSSGKKFGDWVAPGQEAWKAEDSWPPVAEPGGQEMSKTESRILQCTGYVSSISLRLVPVPRHTFPLGSRIRLVDANTPVVPVLHESSGNSPHEARQRIPRARRSAGRFSTGCVLAGRHVPVRRNYRGKCAKTIAKSTAKLVCQAGSPSRVEEGRDKKLESTDQASRECQET
jgi:hypothetical protein